MLKNIDNFYQFASSFGINLVPHNVVQTLSEDELIELLPKYDGWIIGDDPASFDVLQAGSAGKLKAVVKWGVGTDNVDFDACQQLSLPVSNTPNVFGNEVADIALCYLIGLARHTFCIDRLVRSGLWDKPSGISLFGKRVALVGYGDIGQHLLPRLASCGLNTTIYDPALLPDTRLSHNAIVASWPHHLNTADFLIFTCSLTDSSRHMFNSDILSHLKPGVRIVNVGRGPVIQESALLQALESGLVHSAALDVFEFEPLPTSSKLLSYDNCIFGTHNASNTVDAVQRVSEQAIQTIAEYLS